MRVTRAVAAAVALSAAAAALAAQELPRSSTADVIALAVCVIDADIRTAAIAQLQRGVPLDQAQAHLRAQMPDRVYRAQAQRLVDEVYRARPASLRAYVAERLQACAAGAARRVDPRAADGCYQLTRYASDFFRARDAGVALPEAVASARELVRAQGLDEGAGQRLAALAARVYGTTVPAPDFRAGLFFHCVRTPTSRPAPR